MSDSKQKLNTILPMAETAVKADSADPIESEYLQGKALFERGELGPAAVALHNALLGYEEKKNDTGIANASNQLGHVCLQRKEYDKALEHYTRVEQICRNLNDPLSLLALSKQFILVYTEAGRYAKAIEQCLDLVDEKSIDIDVKDQNHQPNNNS